MEPNRKADDHVSRVISDFQRKVSAYVFLFL